MTTETFLDQARAGALDGPLATFIQKIFTKLLASYANIQTPDELRQKLLFAIDCLDAFIPTPYDLPLAAVRNLVSSPQVIAVLFDLYQKLTQRPEPNVAPSGAEFASLLQAAAVAATC